MNGSFLTFLGVSIVVIVAPGPDTALTIRNTVRGGLAPGIGTALGVSAGQLIWALATGVGLVAVLRASEPVFRAVRLAGAAYLVWLGLHSVRAAAAARRPAPTGETAGGRLSSRAAFVQGIVNNLGNPKMAVFFASVLPQFTTPGRGMVSALVLLGIVFSAVTFVLACRLCDRALDGRSPAASVTPAPRRRGRLRSGLDWTRSEGGRGRPVADASFPGSTAAPR
jgi:threonine/homoserine/homoserine lactone efflux protein